ncbi:MAG TPA: DUF4405 domain-containing protein [Phycisphaerae bacterium]|nr:DUF4405 domain-containing protein [Phycisphaerae bacterium]
MSKVKSLKVLNVILAVLIVSQAVSGFTRARLSPEAFEWIHERGGIALLVGAALHVALNWGWVRSSYFRRRKAPQG